MTHAYVGVDRKTGEVFAIQVDMPGVKGNPKRAAQFALETSESGGFVQRLPIKDANAAWAAKRWPSQQAVEKAGGS